MEKLIAHTPIFDLVKKQDEMNTIGFDPVGINSTDWIIIIVEQNGQWLMVKQLRYGLMQECEEFCSGMVDAGERPHLTARRELEEETGYYVFNADDIKYLGKFAANPAFMNNYMHYFYVNLDEVEHEVRSTKRGEHEKLDVYWKDKKQAVDDYLKSHGSVFIAGALFLMNINGIN